MRDQLEVAARMWGTPPPELAGPELPEAAAHLWEWFHEMGAGRPLGPAGPLALPNREIAAWCWLSGIRLAPWELQAIRALDGAWLSAVLDQRSTRTSPPPFLPD